MTNTEPLSRRLLALADVIRSTPDARGMMPAGVATLTEAARRLEVIEDAENAKAKAKARHVVVDWREEFYGQWPEAGAFVRAGRAWAVWRLVARSIDGPRMHAFLLPVDPHDVPFDAEVRELPMPVEEVGHA